MLYTQGYILLVADNADNWQTLSALLTANGYTVRHAPNKISALAIADVTPPDLILLSIGTPMTKSYAIAQRLKTATHTQTIPIIFLYAANATAAEKAHGLTQGAADYITQSSNEIEILHRVAQQLRTHELQERHHQQNTCLPRE